MKKINVTKTFLPSVEEYKKYVEKIWQTGQLTNQGPLLKEFEEKVKKYLKVENFHFVSNGTTALQLALKALDITEGEIITTPFSYVATTSAILWERCVPIYVDIEPKTYCIDANKIETAITKNTKAILAVHVFGNPCDTQKIETIAQKHKLKVIYDAAHAFGVSYKGTSLLSYGDISVCSFHSTKVFHTIEGGCLVTKNKDLSNKIDLIKRFGHLEDEHYMLGINAKASEFQAAMGLCNFKFIKKIILSRREVFTWYDDQLSTNLEKPLITNDEEYNYAYYPVVFHNKKQTSNVVDALNKENIYPRKYFFPSLNTLPYLTTEQSCPISEDISQRILCLPLHTELTRGDVNKITRIIKQTI